MPDTYVDGLLVDHHCHGLVRRDLDREAFESLLNEGAGGGRLAGSAFDSMLGLAVRRWCAPLLGLPPLCDPDTYLAQRTELGSADVDRRFLVAAGVSDFVVDTGFVPEPLSSPTEVAALGDARGHEVVRLEAIAQELLSAGVAPGDVAAAVVEVLGSCEAVGAKSIAAYRVGLELAADKPDDEAFTEALTAALGSVDVGSDVALRLADPVVSSWLAWTAVGAGLPLQIHVGYGDASVDLHRCDPLLLSGFLRATSDHGVPVILLHNYPFHRNASYLAQVFDHVFMDVSLAVHNTGALSRQVISETLELVPFGKLLYASDAFGLSELSYLGAHLFRRGLSDCLDTLVEAGEMGSDDAAHVAALVGSGNARRVYRLS